MVASGGRSAGRIAAVAAGSILVAVLVCGAQRVAAADDLAAQPQDSLPSGAGRPEAAPDAGGTQKSSLAEVSRELRRIADTYGPDAVALQAKLLLRSTMAGAIGPTEVKVAGPSTHMGAEYLEIDVDTGLFFEETAGTTQDRADQVWSVLVAPALEEMTSFELKPAGLEVVFLYRVQDLARSPSGKLDASAACRAERLAVALDRRLLEAVARDELFGEALRHAVRFDASAVELPAPSSAQ